MSVQTNQYLIYGIKKPYDFMSEWEAAQEGGEIDFHDNFSEFCDDSAFNKEIASKDGISVVYDGMGSKWLFIGEVIEKGSDDEPMVAANTPFGFPKKTAKQKQVLRDTIKKHFDTTGELGYWLFTKYR